MALSEIHPADTPDDRKARGAFFTPPAIVDFITNWESSFNWHEDDYRQVGRSACQGLR